MSEPHLEWVNPESSFSIFQDQTSKLKEVSWISIKSRIRRVLEVMEEEQINLPLFLDALSWGKEDCIDDPVVKHARTQLMTSDELPRILRRWWKPPRSQSSNSSRPEGARDAIEKLSAQCIAGIIQEEMLCTEVLLQTSEPDFSVKELQEIHFETLIQKMRNQMPVFWLLLEAAARPTSKSVRTGKSTKRAREKIIMMSIATFTYARNQLHNLFQRMLAIYLKFHGLSAKGFDTLHYLGLTMSMKWTTNIVKKIGNDTRQSLLAVMNDYAWFISHDNLNIAFQVYSQRIESKTHFDSGTAGTIYLKRYQQPLSLDLPLKLRQRRAEGMINPISLLEIALLDSEGRAKLSPYFVDVVLDALLKVKEFDQPTYKDRKEDIIQPTSALSPLPSGQEFITEQFVLGTVKIDEASYEGTDQLIKEWLTQLEICSPEDRQRFSMEKLLLFIGDQLTVKRLRGLYTFRAEDCNSLDRLDFIIPQFRWLHLMMAFANSLYKQYLGTNTGHGIKHAVTLLQRKGLARVLTKGPFFHTLDELLLHVLQGHLRCAWHLVAGVEDLSSLRNKSASELRSYARRIVTEYASNEAMQACEEMPTADRDDVQKHTIMMMRDLISYATLSRAIREGDVGIMENMLPYLLFRFQGGGNFKYAIEILELLQNLHKEWPDELKHYVRQHGWLVNFQGKRDTFLAIDMAQEHNIRDLKVTYLPDGPNSDWSYLKIISWAIPAIRKITAHVEKEAMTLSRGKKHSVPAAEKDINLLEIAYRTNTLHIYKKSRMPKKKDDYYKDYVGEGFNQLQLGKTMKRWINGRSYEREKQDLWELRDDEDLDEILRENYEQENNFMGESTHQNIGNIELLSSASEDEEEETEEELELEFEHE